MAHTAVRPGIQQLTFDEALSSLSVPAHEAKSSPLVKGLGKDQFNETRITLDSGQPAELWVKQPSKDAIVPGVVWTALENLQALAFQAAIRKGVPEQQATKFSKEVLAFTVHANPAAMGLPVDSGVVMVLPIPPDLRDLTSEGKDLFRRLIRHEHAHAQSGDNERVARENELHGREKSYFKNERVTDFLGRHQIDQNLPNELAGFLSPVRIGGVSTPTLVNMQHIGSVSTVGGADPTALAQSAYGSAVSAWNDYVKGKVARDEAQKELNRLRKLKVGNRTFLEAVLAVFGLEGEEIATQKAIVNQSQREMEASLKQCDGELFNASTYHLQSVARSQGRPVQSISDLQCPPGWDERLWKRALEVRERPYL